MRGIVVTTENKMSVLDFKEPFVNTVGSIVGGDLEQVWPRRLARPYLMIVNGEGRLTGLPENTVGSYLYGMDQHGVPIAGNIVILKEKNTRDGTEWCSLQENDIDKLTAQIKGILQNRQQSLHIDHKSRDLER